MKRRSFFKSIAKAAAIIALAPQIAFRVKEQAFWTPQPYQKDIIDHWIEGKATARMGFWYQPTWESYLADEDYRKAYVCMLNHQKTGPS